MTVIDWLLDSEPSIRWQVMRDLAHKQADVVAAERSRIATEGWGGRLLALPGVRRPMGRQALVARLDRHLPRPGAPAADGARSRQRAGATGPSVSSVSRSPGETPTSRVRGQTTTFFDGEVEPCINGNTVATGAYFGVDMTPLVDPAPRRAAPGRRLELRGRERRDGLVDGDDGQCARGPAGVRRREWKRRRGRGRPAPWRGLPARARPVPPEVHWRGHQFTLAALLVPALVPLRRPARARVPARGRGQARRARWTRRLGSSRATVGQTAAGRSRTSTRARSTSRWRRARARRAAGTPSARCACSTGTGRPDRPQVPPGTSRCLVAGMADLRRRNAGTPVPACGPNSCRRRRARRTGPSRWRCPAHTMSNPSMPAG